jgi:hypothetical protein
MGAADVACSPPVTSPLRPSQSQEETEASEAGTQRSAQKQHSHTAKSAR